MTYNKTLLKEISKINKENYKNSMEWDYVNYLDTGNLTENKIDKVQRIDLKTDKLPSRAKRIPSVKNILYSTVRPNQRHYGFINKETIPNLLVSTGFVVLEIDEDKANPKYVYYYLIQDSIINMLQNIGETSTSAYPSVKVSDIENIELNLPTLSEQEAIADILSSFDNKIENNNAIIANLEEQAQTIFKSWFIDFEPFQDGKFKKSELGLIPLNWNYNILGEVCKCVLGGTPSRKNERYWGGDIGWINSGEVNRDRIIEPTEFITQEGLNNSATKLLPEKTTLIAITGATLGQVSLLEIDCCTNQSIVGIIENSEVPFEYIYPFIKTEIKSIISNQTGAAQQHINLTDVRNTKILLPESNVLKAYQKIVSPMYKMITNLYFENKKLEKMRDTLLPKLISGEIRVEEAIEVE